MNILITLIQFATDSWRYRLQDKKSSVKESQENQNIGLLAVNSARLRNRGEISKQMWTKNQNGLPRKIWDNENIPPRARGIVKAVKNKMLDTEKKNT